MTTGGDHFGRYELRGELGRGGFATVYRAWDPALGREVALKALQPHLALDPNIRQRFMAEARAIAQLHHPNIITVHEVDETNGRPYFTMELVNGPTLAALVAPGQGLPLGRVAEIMRSLASAIDYLHTRRLVHRDVKAANVMLDAWGRVVLMDFGVARALDQTQLTQSGISIGTPEAMAPEQVRGQPAGPPADIYALGILAYRLLAGRAPFVGETIYVLHAHAYDLPPPLADLRAGLPDSVYAAIDAALAKAPQDRPPSAEQFAAALSVPSSETTMGDTTARFMRLPARGPGESRTPTPPPTRQEPPAPRQEAALPPTVRMDAAPPTERMDAARTPAQERPAGSMPPQFGARDAAAEDRISPPIGARPPVPRREAGEAPARLLPVSDQPDLALTRVAPPPPERRASPQAPPPDAGGRRNPWPLIAAGVVVVLLIGGGVVYLIGRGGSSNNKAASATAPVSASPPPATSSSATSAAVTSSTASSSPSGTAGSASTTRTATPAGAAASATPSRTSTPAPPTPVPTLPPAVAALAAGSGAAGYQEGTGDKAQFNGPKGLAVDAAGNVYVGDTGNNRVRLLDTKGATSLVAGPGAGTAATGGLQNGGSKDAARFQGPWGLVVDKQGNVYVADTLNHRIRKITPAGASSIFAGNPDEKSGTGLGAGGLADGPHEQAKFNQPTGLAIDTQGNLYVADQGNNRIRKIAPDGTVSTFAGGGEAGSASAGYADGPRDQARFNGPSALAVDISGDLFVADTFNNLIRKVTPEGTVSTYAGTVAGNGGAQGNADGPASKAGFALPGGLAVDSAGVVYVSDSSNHRIRRIGTDGTVTTIAGDKEGYAEGTGTAALFGFPAGLALSPDNNTLFVADSSNNRIRKLTVK